MKDIQIEVDLLKFKSQKPVNELRSLSNFLKYLLRLIKKK